MLVLDLTRPMIKVNNEIIMMFDENKVDVKNYQSSKVGRPYYMANNGNNDRI